MRTKRRNRGQSANSTIISLILGSAGASHVAGGVEAIRKDHISDTVLGTPSKRKRSLLLLRKPIQNSSGETDSFGVEVGQL